MTHASSQRPRRSAAVRLLRIGALISPPFLALIVFLALHRMGWVERHRHIAYERTLILNLVLYWALATLLVAALVYRRGAVSWLRENKAPVILLAASTLVSLGFAEVAMRILRPGVVYKHFRNLPDKRLHHRNTPGATAGGMGGNVVTTNADGFRTGHSRERFSEHGTRIALLGDSFVFGLGVDAEEAVAEVMERRLREALGSDDVAVLNTGVISYSPMLQRLAFRDVVRSYEPTLTLMILDINDIGDDLHYSGKIASGDSYDPIFEVPEPSADWNLCDRSALCSNAKPLLWRLAAPLQVLQNLLPSLRPADDYYKFEIELGGKVETDRFFVLRHPLETTRPYFEATWGFIERAAREVRATGSEFVLVVAPRYFHWNDAECPENWESFRYGVDEPYENAYLRFFDEKRAAAGFEVFSLLPAFTASEETPLVFSHDPHWNEAGHRLVGEALARYLLDRELVPAP